MLLARDQQQLEHAVQTALARLRQGLPFTWWTPASPQEWAPAARSLAEDPRLVRIRTPNASGVPGSLWVPNSIYPFVRPVRCPPKPAALELPVPWAQPYARGLQRASRGWLTSHESELAELP